MSEVGRFHGRVAALGKHGAAPEVLLAARRGLAAAKLRKAADAERARVGLPPLPDDLAALVTQAAFLGEAA